MDIKNFKFKPSSAIIISTTVDTESGAVKIWLDDELVARQSPVNLQEIALGQHLLKIKKNGYHQWEKSLNLNDEYIINLYDIYLVPQQGQIQLKVPLSKLVIKHNHELWDIKSGKPVLVGRYREPLLAAYNVQRERAYLLIKEAEVLICDFDLGNCVQIRSRKVN